MPGLPLWSCTGPNTPPGSMVTIRIRSWRPAMPSISGPRSTVASNFTVTPFVSGATCSLLIVLSSLYFQVLTHQYQATPAHGLFFRTGVHNGLVVDPVFPDRVCPPSRHRKSRKGSPDLIG